MFFLPGKFTLKSTSLYSYSEVQSITGSVLGQKCPISHVLYESTDTGMYPLSETDKSVKQTETIKTWFAKNACNFHSKF